MNNTLTPSPEDQSDLDAGSYEPSNGELVRSVTSDRTPSSELAELRAGIKRLDLIFRNAVDIIVMIDASNGQILRVSDAVRGHLGYEPSGLVGMSFTELLPEEDGSFSPTPSGDSLRGMILDGVFLEQPLLAEDGSCRDFDMTASLVGNNHESLILVTLRDATERKRYEEKLHVRNSALDSSLSATAIAACDWTVTYANEALLTTWGFDCHEEELSGMPLRDLWVDDDSSRSLRDQMQISGKWTGEITCVRKNGEEFPALTMANTVLTETGDRVCMVFSFVDITARRKLEEELTALSLRDSLTGLYNRRGLLAVGEELLKTARRNDEEISVFFVDLDCLKRVNDLYGHDEGDEVLCEVASILRSATREHDLACRIGGDEFALLIRKKRGSGVSPIRKRLTASLDEHNRSSDKPCRISISVGCSSGDPSSHDVIADLLLRADRAMYTAKRKKKLARSDEDLLSCGGVTWREDADDPESD